MLSQGAFYGMSRSDTRKRTDELLESLQLTDLVKRTVLSLSGGQRRRLDIAMGLMHRPVLLFLDEPSTGLDPHSRANLWQHILDLRASTGTTVFVTTHYLEEADQLAGRVMIMDEGRIIADATPDRLKAELAGDSVLLDFADEGQAVAAALELTDLPDVKSVDRDGMTVTLAVGDAGTTVPSVIRRLDSLGLRDYRARTRIPTLDDVFLALTGRSLREEGQLQGAEIGEADPDGAGPPSPVPEAVGDETRYQEAQA
jgi:ABC-2 type transport system ATP-binding protein